MEFVLKILKGFENQGFLIALFIDLGISLLQVNFWLPKIK
tara:strand:+ start:806 stop:925 length:120 start_codon:yes stop_codon:yes gene_type:complete